MTLDERYLSAAIALSQRARGTSSPNPNVGCVVVKDGRVVGRGWTQAGGRPHAEAVALKQAGDAARGAALYVSLEPCAHESERGPACADIIAAAGIKRVVTALTDPDPRTNGKGLAKLCDAGIEVQDGLCIGEARRAMAPWLTRTIQHRPFVTLKLAASADGRTARPPGEDRWITGEAARAHGHVERTRHDAILVGRATFDADNPALDVRLRGLESRSPLRLLLTSGEAPENWQALANPADIASLSVQSLLVEGGGKTAASFLSAGLVDRILLYRAPMIIGSGEDVLAELDLDPPGSAWMSVDSRMLGSDKLDVYEAVRE